MDQEDRSHPRRRLVIAGVAVIASLGIAVPAALAATGGGNDGATTPTNPSQTQPQTGQQDAPHQGTDRGPQADHHGPCPEKDGNGDRGGSEQGSSGAPPAAPQSTDVATF